MPGHILPGRFNINPTIVQIRPNSSKRTHISNTSQSMDIHIHYHQELFNTVPTGCQIQLKSRIIQPDSAKTGSDLETIHNEWSWDSKCVIPHLSKLNHWKPLIIIY
jgi:hypothetical protein